VRSGNRLVATSAALLVSMWAGGASAQSAISSSFDHFTTGFRLDGAHQTAECESCHVGAVFQGTPGDCASCHTIGGRIQATARPADHVLTTDFCEDCHSTAAWFPLTEMNHDSIFGSCTTCHNNVQTVGKPPDHPPTQQQCDSCHRTTGWFPVLFDHFGIGAGCSTCHDGVGATGKHDELLRGLPYDRSFRSRCAGRSLTGHRQLRQLPQ